MTRYINADETLNDIFERHCKECVSRKGVKNGKLRVLYDIGDAPCRACLIDDVKTMIYDTPTVEAIPIDWIENQVDKGKWRELVQRWRENADK